MNGMLPDDIAISGIGIVSPFGIGAEASVNAYQSSHALEASPVAELAGTALENALAYTVPHFDPGVVLGSRRMLKFMSPAAVLGCIAAKEAAASAGMKGRFTPERLGLFTSTGLSAADLNEIRPVVEKSIDNEGSFSCKLLGERGLSAANPLMSFKILSNIPPCLVSIQEDIKGPNFIFNPWEGQGGAAIIEACDAIASGEVEGALTGGADFASHPSTYIYLKQAKLLEDGEYPSAGAAYLFLEKAWTALRDKRRIYALIKRMELKFSKGGQSDPLATRMGRAFAAAPAILLALSALSGQRELAICGVDRQRFAAGLEMPS